ncbi:hypothetical protein M3Y94_01106300 [Aphelenchoides besseyi]|nr:hypothetical protein M3Y94_01106300 [Aphelenchoides besseyi]
MYEPIKYPSGKEFPVWAMVFGFCLSASSMIVIPGYAIYYLFLQRNSLSLKERWEKGIHPPKDLDYRLNHFRSAQNEEEMKFIDEKKNNNL